MNKYETLWFYGIIHHCKILQFIIILTRKCVTNVFNNPTPFFPPPPKK